MHLFAFLSNTSGNPPACTGPMNTPQRLVSLLANTKKV